MSAKNSRNAAAVHTTDSPTTEPVTVSAGQCPGSCTTANGRYATAVRASASAVTPATPTSSPSWRRGPSRSPPVAQPSSAPTSGTAAISRPASELLNRCSAEARNSHGTAISTAVNTSSGRQWRTSGRSCPRAPASGRSSSAAMTVRKNTRDAGLSAPTATLISRYGTPQITPTAANSNQPRRDTRPPDWSFFRQERFWSAVLSLAIDMLPASGLRRDHDHGDLPRGARLVVVVRRPERGHHRPQPGLLHRIGGLRGPVEDVRADLDPHARIGHQVAVPLRRVGAAAVGGYDEVPVAVAPVDQRGPPRLAGAPAERDEQQGRYPAPEVSLGAPTGHVARDVVALPARRRVERIIEFIHAR